MIKSGAEAVHSVRPDIEYVARAKLLIQTITNPKIYLIFLKVLKCNKLRLDPSFC